MNRAPNPSEPFGQSPSQPLPVPEWWLAAGTGPVARPPQVVQPQSLPVSQPSQWNPYQGTRPPGPVMIPRQFGRAMAPLPGEVSDAMSQPALPAGPSAWPQARVSMGPGLGMPHTAAAPGIRMPGLDQPQWGAGRAAERGPRGPRKRRIIAACVAALAVGTALNQAVIQPQLRARDVGSGSWLQAVKDQSKSETAKVPSVETPANPIDDGEWYWPVTKHLDPGPCWNKKIAFNGKYHAGMDINVLRSSDPPEPIKAMRSGTVVEVFKDWKKNPNVSRHPAGNYLIVKTNDPTPIYYSVQHMKAINVDLGDEVVGGKTELGMGGLTGNIAVNNRTVAHVHVTASLVKTTGSYDVMPQNKTKAYKRTVNILKYLPEPAPDGYYCTR